MLRSSLCVSLFVLSACAARSGAPRAAAAVEPKRSEEAPRYALYPNELLAPELANEHALERLGEPRDAIPVFATERFELQSSEDRKTNESYMLYLLHNGNRDMANFVCKSRDAKMGATYPSPRYDLDACPESYVRGAVLARFEGGGTLTRLWLATKLIAKELPKETRVRIYRDHIERPVVDLPLRALLDGSTPLFAAPFGMPQTTQVGWYYPVVFQDGLIIAIDDVPRLDAIYYQAVVRRDESTTPVAAALTAAREHVARALQAPMPSLDTEVARTIEAGSTTTLFELAGPQTIEAFSVRAAALDALTPARIQVVWDDAKEPAIDLPLRELFSAALEAPEQASSFLSSSPEAGGIRLTIALPMPFTKRARITVVNQGRDALALEARIALRRGVPSRPFGQLHVERHETVGPTDQPSHPLVHAKGRGRWVALCLTLEGHAWSHPAFREPLNFLEGDPVVVADGQRIGGTGTEDIFDSVFYFQNSPLVTPFVQTWGVDRKQGKASACRWNVHGTELDFADALDADLEIGPGDPSLLDRYRSVAFLYR